MESIAKSTKSLFTRISSSVTNYFSKGSAKQETFVSKGKLPSPVSLFFYADSLNTIKEVKKKIDSEYKSKYFHSTNIDDEVIKDLPYNQTASITRTNATVYAIFAKREWVLSLSLHSPKACVERARSLLPILSPTLMTAISIVISSFTNLFNREWNITQVSIPDYWTPMENEDYIKVALTSGDEYDSVKNVFPGNFQIVTIERIQNKSLYIQYQAQLEKMNSTNPQGTKNETQGLWHGTSKDVTEKINKNGFNRSYCGKNATAYGGGVYFAVNPQYSLSDTYSPPDSNGHKHIYMCNVLTGMFCRGDSSMRVPPDNPAVQGVPYNSSVDDIKSPKIYVSFHDANVYPAYLITCK
ncbi:PARP10_14_15 [Acanthosepion pharaonis]|uniref:Poly [ADP-ribose] polymerase n=1 Tax=Acanthosepion pharaonis TaxID=158019 RepID=A0A812CK61_ACAPH|nr:PARP10_14_15 [Sepia pharaonis]